jgi:hypothetical protein
MARRETVFALGWTALACGSAWALSRGLVGAVHLPDAAHLVGHLVLFGVVAAVLGRRHGADLGLLGALLAGAAVEVAQMVAVERLLLREASFDLAVDALAAMAGLALSNRTDVARRLGLWLHPAVVFPVGLVGVVFAAERDLFVALCWGLVGVACLAPAGLLWLYGSRQGWWSDLDLVDREERPVLFAVACLSAASLACAVRAGGASLGIVRAADLVLIASVTLTTATVAGFKLSGHVAISLLLATAIAPFSERGPVLFLAVALLLSWARVRARVHRPIEVAGAWALGAILGLVPL